MPLQPEAKETGTSGMSFTFTFSVASTNISSNKAEADLLPEAIGPYKTFSGLYLVDRTGEEYQLYSGISSLIRSYCCNTLANRFVLSMIMIIENMILVYGA